MTQTFTGSCLCGTVEFRISGSFDAFFLCHCQRCRKDTGSAHAANLFASAAALTWLRGEDGVRTFSLPETRHAKSFCVNCGSALPMTQMNGKLLVVPAGCLDSPVDIRPDAHIFCASRAGWDDGLDQIPQLEGLPA